MLKEFITTIGMAIDQIQIQVAWRGDAGRRLNPSFACRRLNAGRLRVGVGALAEE